MRQTSCKRLLILSLNLCFIALATNAQDSSKVVSPQTPKKTVTAPAKNPVKAPATSPAESAAKPASATPAKPAVQAPVTTQVTKPATTAVKAPAKPVDSSLRGQYEDLLKYSWMQKGYKVIEPARLSNLWKSVNDSLNNNKKQLAAAKQQLDEQAKQINELKSSTGSNSTLTANSTAVDQIQVLGMTVDVLTYNLIVWGAIIALALGLTAVLFTTTKNSHEARHHRQLYEEISSEYNTFKAKSKEKQLKLARELQTERNTLEELMAKKNNEENSGKKK